jgi:hypothetical protein
VLIWPHPMTPMFVCLLISKNMTLFPVNAQMMLRG